MQNIHPLVSVALCTYNGEIFLEEQLESLLLQTYTNLEIVVVDDCSGDKTMEILSTNHNRSNKLRIYQNQGNLGYTKNFEKAISLCQGEYIALCDQDDIWELDKIKLLVQNIKDNVLIYHNSQFITQQGHIINRKMSDLVNFYTGDKPEAFIFFNCISSHAILFRKELIDYLFPFPEAGFHDAWIGYVACNLGPLSLFNECLVKYRQHHHSATDILKLKGQSFRLGKKESFQNTLSFMEKCKGLSINKNPGFILELYKLYNDRTQKKFNFSLFIFFIMNFRRFFTIYKKGFLSKLNFAFKHSRGIKIKGT